MKTFENAQVGDEVWSSAEGFGTIQYIEDYTNDNSYPIKVKFKNKNKYEWFSMNGFFYHSNKFPALFWEEQKLDLNTKRPEPEIDWSKVPKDTKVFVRDNLSDEKIPQYFCSYLPSATYKFYTFSKNSKLINACGISGWRYCELHPDQKVEEEWCK